MEEEEYLKGNWPRQALKARALHAAGGLLPGGQHGVINYSLIMPRQEVLSQFG